LNALSLLGLLELVDVELAVEYIISCANFDGGFGVCPGAESHSGQIYTCLAALSIAGRIDVVDADKLGRWLSERQVEGGGLNGRPEKLEDVCYSWWVGSSLAMIGRLHWVDGGRLAGFILSCQVSGSLDGGEIVLMLWGRIRRMVGLRIDRGIWWMFSIRILGLQDFRYWDFQGWRR